MQYARTSSISILIHGPVKSQPKAVVTACEDLADLAAGLGPGEQTEQTDRQCRPGDGRHRQGRAIGWESQTEGADDHGDRQCNRRRWSDRAPDRADADWAAPRRQPET